MKSFEVAGYTAQVITDDDAAQLLGVPSWIPCAYIEKHLKGSLITVTSAFWKLTESTQKVIMTHEIGHLACGHLDLLKDGVLTVNPVMEAEADVWAAKIIGDIVFDTAIKETGDASFKALVARNIMADTESDYLLITKEIYKRISDRKSFC